MPALRLVYLALALLGAAAPLSAILPWLAGQGWSPFALLAAWTVDGAVLGLTRDLAITAVALSIWIIAECRARDDRLSLVAIAATFLVGPSCGLPLYLFLRTRPMERD